MLAMPFDRRLDPELEELREHEAALDRMAQAGNKEALMLWVKLVEPDPRDGLTLEMIRATVRRLSATFTTEEVPSSPQEEAEPLVLRPAA